jgi:hypothetical protein
MHGALARGFFLGFALAGHLAGAASALAGSFNLDLLDQLNLGPPETVTDVDVAGTYAYVGRGPLGLSVVDIANPRHLRVVSELNLPGQMVVNDVFVAGGRAYLANESYTGVAVYILDVANPAAPHIIGAIIQPILNSCHNLYAEGDYLYVIGLQSTGGWRTRIFDVRDPLVPDLVAELPTAGAHDITVLDGVLYEAGGWGGLHLWDVSDPANPRHLAEADLNRGPRPHYHSHSVWPTEDRRYVVCLNEIESWWGPGHVVGGGVKIWRWDGAGELELAATWRPEVAQGVPLQASHNVVVQGRFAYLSYYQAGIRVLDLIDPEDPVEVAFYDTYLEPPTALFQGAWGVDVTSGDEPIVLGSDRQTGLYAMQFKNRTKATMVGSVHESGTDAPLPGAIVRLRTAERTAIAMEMGNFSTATGEGRHLLEVWAPGFAPLVLQVDLRPGVKNEPFWIELSPLNRASFAAGPSPLTATVGSPPRFGLAPAAPNPFQSSTRIPYELVGIAGTSDVRLTVHDAAGRVVRVLRAGEETTGPHAAEWDGRDDAGRAAPAGVYYVRLAAGGETRSSRVVLLR